MRIGTRGSQLALWQANAVARLLAARGYEPELVIIRTTGDKRQNVALASIGGKGLFIKELEEALERKQIDVAVHSLKDVPSLISPQFALVGFLERADPRDAWVHPGHRAIEDLPRGAVVGTGSPRRRAQLIEKFPHLVVEPMRGNVDTRINKASAGSFAGLILAAAGLMRLGRQRDITRLFAVEEMVPAACQGIIGIEALAGNALAREAAQSITHAPSRQAALCERAVLQKFGERLDCHTAIAVHCSAGAEVTIEAFLADYHGERSIRTTQRGGDANAVVDAVHGDLVAHGAMELLLARR